MRFILSVIAVCLVLITAKLYIPEVNAEVAGMNYTELRRDRDFKKAVTYLIENDYDIEDEIEEIVIDTLRSNYQAKSKIKSIMRSCSVYIDSFVIDGGYAYVNC